MKRRCQITVFLLITMAASLGRAQSRTLPAPALPPQPGSAQGQLSVTLTIVPSVGVVLDATGQPKLIVANAADPADNVSSLRIAPAAGQKPKKTKTKK